MLRLQTRDQFENRTFATTTWTQNSDEFANARFIVDHKRNVLDRRKRVPFTRVVSLCDVLEFDDWGRRRTLRRIRIFSWPRIDLANTDLCV